MNRQQGKLIAILAASLMMHAACDPVTLATTAGGVVGLSVLEERSAETSYQDRKIQFSIHGSIQDNGLGTNNEVFVMVYESEVMLAGFVPDAEDRKRIRQIAENTPGVVRLYDDFRHHKMDLIDYSHDRFLGLKLSTKLSLEQNIHAVNYIIRIVDGVAYMMGLALSKEELDQVRIVTSSVSGIRGMVSRIKVRAPVIRDPVAAEIIHNSAPDTTQATSVDVVEAAPIDHFGGTIDVQPLPVAD